MKCDTTTFIITDFTETSGNPEVEEKLFG